MKYNKLIRDKIPAIIKSQGRNSLFHIADDKEYAEKLKQKLGEEVKEFLESESPEELADILEVVDAICKYKNISQEELIKIKTKKHEARGGFDQRIILEES